VIEDVLHQVEVLFHRCLTMTVGACKKFCGDAG